MSISKTYPDRPGTAILDAVDVHVGGDLHRIGSHAIRVSVKGSGWITTRSQILADFSDPTTPGQSLKALVRPLHATREAQDSA